MLIYVPFVIPETPKEKFQISCALLFNQKNTTAHLDGQRESDFDALHALGAEHVVSQQPHGESTWMTGQSNLDELSG